MCCPETPAPFHQREVRAQALSSQTASSTAVGLQNCSRQARTLHLSIWYILILASELVVLGFLQPLIRAAVQVKVSEKRPGTGSQRCVRGSTRSAWLAFIILLCVPSELCLEQKYCFVETIDLTKAVVKDKTNFLWFLSSRTVNSWKVSKLHCSSYFSSYV